MAARIIGTGRYLPENVVTNDDLSKIVDTSDDWIATKTGIKERRISTEEGTVELAIKAGMEAMRNAGIEAEQIDMIICATCSPDKFLPATACEVQEAIGAVHATCFDLSAACSGFLFALNTAHGYIHLNLASNVLVIGVETLSKIMDWTDRSSCILFGDGAGAAILAKDNEAGIIDTVTGSDGSGGKALYCEARALNHVYTEEKFIRDFITMDGRAVYKFAVRTVPDSILKLLYKANQDIEEIKYFILHQANERIIESVSKRLKIDMEKFPINIQKYGNTSAASIPILLDELNQEGKLHRGDKIILSGFGGGLTWGSILVEW